MNSIAGQIELFKRFAYETKIHGIRRVFEGKRASVLFWATVALISFCMAAKDLVELVNSYQLERTTTQISLSNDTSFAWKSPTLCMEFLAMYSNMTSNYLYYSSLGVDAPPIRWTTPELGVTDEIFDQFYGLADSDNYTSADLLSNLVVLLDPNVMYYTYMMLGYWSEVEGALLGENKNVQKGYQFNLGYNDVLVAEGAQKFYEFYKQRSPAVTLTKLSKVFGMLYCLQQLIGVLGIGHVTFYGPNVYGQFENYRYFGDPNYINLPLCKANMITHLGFGMVCSKVFESPTVPFVPDYNYFAIYNSFKTYPPVFTDTTDYSPSVAEY